MREEIGIRRPLQAAAKTIAAIRIHHPVTMTVRVNTVKATISADAVAATMNQVMMIIAKAHTATMILTQDVAHTEMIHSAVVTTTARKVLTRMKIHMVALTRVVITMRKTITMMISAAAMMRIMMTRKTMTMHKVSLTAEAKAIMIAVHVRTIHKVAARHLLMKVACALPVVACTAEAATTLLVATVANTVDNQVGAHVVAGALTKAAAAVPA